MKLNQITNELKEKLKEVVKQNSAEGLLFSGGLDSSILALLSPQTKAITITLKSYGEDLKYAKFLSKFLDIPYYHKVINVEEALNSLPRIIKFLKSFDLAIPNDVTVYFGLSEAKKLGLKSVMTADGADELFAGYKYMADLPDLNGYIRKISPQMFFSANIIGKHLGLEIKQPFLDKELINFALKIPAHFKVKRENNKKWGKWILRKAFAAVLPSEIIWQDKRPLEYGSGTTKLREIIAGKVKEKEFAENSYPLKFMDKEHFYYYKIYRNVVGEIPVPKKQQKKCPFCGGGMEKNSAHCKICGRTESLFLKIVTAK